MSFGQINISESYFMCFQIGTIPIMLAMSCYTRGSEPNTHEEKQERIISSAVVFLLSSPLFVVTLPIAAVGAAYTTIEAGASLLTHGYSNNRFFQSTLEGSGYSDSRASLNNQPSSKGINPQ